MGKNLWHSQNQIDTQRGSTGKQCGCSLLTHVHALQHHSLGSHADSQSDTAFRFLNPKLKTPMTSPVQMHCPKDRTRGKRRSLEEDWNKSRRGNQRVHQQSLSYHQHWHQKIAQDHPSIVHHTPRWWQNPEYTQKQISPHEKGVLREAIKQQNDSAYMQCFTNEGSFAFNKTATWRLRTMFKQIKYVGYPLVWNQIFPQGKALPVHFSWSCNINDQSNRIKKWLLQQPRQATLINAFTSFSSKRYQRSLQVLTDTCRHHSVWTQQYSPDPGPETINCSRESRLHDCDAQDKASARSQKNH